ncbi:MULTISPECIES: phosphoglycerate kinase [unclassified Streptomyces]|uniref:phosphoglycerate kinase n=1 Tax=unclassified Streptomyces TaxID=2593676 RepID=UPI000DD86570|nr:MULTISPECIES: phosphoglycerate kinase [unclassified Streptomyces]QZZ32148.1 phosphoglycerate kinase [Streptomyces sp. ST1015]
MASDAPLAGVPRLADRTVAPGERWILSAGFNTGVGLAETGRIDCELADIAALADAGARVAVLSHQGSHRDGTARGLSHVAAYLARELGRVVAYHPHSADDQAPQVAAAMTPGQIVLFGNTREYPGEEANDPDLARAFARLGDRVAVGGFSKAHRAHASNTGLVGLLPGVAARSLVRDVEGLAPWAVRDGRRSVAVLGGRKPEKVLAGLAGLAAFYDVVVPGGVVLNTLLAALGHRTGASWLGTDPQRCVRVAREVLEGPRKALIHLPSTVYVAPADPAGNPTGPARPLALPADVPDGHAVVDFDLQPWAAAELTYAERAVVAGTPCQYVYGHTRAADAVLPVLAGTDTLLLGGDTVAELPWRGRTSTGGGSALTLLAEGDCAVLRALRAPLLS